MSPVRQTPIQRTVMFICVCSSLCTIVAHNTAQNRPDNFPSCPSDNHHCSDDVYLRERGNRKAKPIWILMKVRDDRVAVASAGPYANHLHITSDR